MHGEESDDPGSECEPSSGSTAVVPGAFEKLIGYAARLGGVETFPDGLQGEWSILMVSRLATAIPTLPSLGRVSNMRVRSLERLGCSLGGCKCAKASGGSDPGTRRRPRSLGRHAVNGLFDGIAAQT